METSRLTGHISRSFNKDIEDLRNSVLAMGGLVESQLSQAITAIVSGDSELGLQVARDDFKVNNLEVEIDEECSRILATRAPAASDLRLIVAIIKTITDLERIGPAIQLLPRTQDARAARRAHGTRRDERLCAPGRRGSLGCGARG
jgi:phosphate transport system protein